MTSMSMTTFHAATARFERAWSAFNTFAIANPAEETNELKDLVFSEQGLLRGLLFTEVAADAAQAFEVEGCRASIWARLMGAGVFAITPAYGAAVCNVDMQVDDTARGWQSTRHDMIGRVDYVVQPGWTVNGEVVVRAYVAVIRQA